MGRARMRGAGSRRALCCAASLTIVAVAGSSSWAASGDLDPEFGGTGHGRVVLGDVRSLDAVAVEPDGGIIEVGDRGGGEAVAIRLGPDGSRDTGFGSRLLTAPGGPADVYAVTIQRDGKILVAGAADTGPTDDMGVWRLLPTGEPDSSFGSDGFASFGPSFESDDAHAVVADSAGRILLAGYTGLNDDMLVVRFTSGGQPDPTFNTVGGVGVPFFQIQSAGGAAAEALAVQPDDGKILVTGNDGFATGMPVYRIIPGDATATGAAVLDDSFGTGGLSVVSGVGNSGSGLSLQPDGRIVAVGSSSSLGNGDPVVVRLLPTGEVDTGYGSDTGVHLQIPGATGGSARALSALPSGGVAVSGMTEVGGSLRGFVARLDPEGNPDPTMGPGGALLLGSDDARLDGLAVQPDGKIVTAGTTSGPAGVVYRLMGEAPPPISAACEGRTATLVGTTAADILVGTPEPDVIAGRGGDDTISGLGDGDIVCGGTGDDHIIAGRGAEILDGQAGRDTLIGGRGRDHLAGGPGRDHLRGGPGPDLLRGGTRADTLSGGTGRDRLEGGPGQDVLRGGPGRDVLRQ